MIVGERSINELAFYAWQVRVSEDREEAISRAGIKTGDTTAALLQVGRPELRIRKICADAWHHL
jgi:hypothetical protein